MTERLVRVSAPHFVAGLVTDGERCTVAAPIMKWAVGKTEDELRSYFTRKGWRAGLVTPSQPSQERTGE